MSKEILFCVSKIYLTSDFLSSIITGNIEMQLWPQRGASRMWEGQCVQEHGFPATKQRFRRYRETSETNKDFTPDVSVDAPVSRCCVKMFIFIFLQFKILFKTVV